MLKNLDKETKLKELKYLGYTKLGKIDVNLLTEIKQQTRELITSTKQKYPRGELFNLINADIETKQRSNKLVKKYFNSYLESVLDTDFVDIYPVSHIIKPFGKKSSIWHQDSAIVDERVSFSLNAWMPLVKSHLLNGCLWILPGSHISTNFKRQFGFNPIEGNTLKRLNKFFVPIFVDAGEVLLFHRNLIHGSSINYLPLNRVALESVVVNKGAQLMNFHRDEKLAKHKILAFHVDYMHFLKQNPKEDFYNGIYQYTEMEDDHKEDISNYLIDNIPLFVDYAKQL